MSLKKFQVICQP